MIEVFAHRGVHAIERENTIGAFRAAVALGVDGVELDVRRTGDGVLVVHHDASVDSLSIAGNDHSALPEYVPTLAQALASLEGVAVNVEIKNERGPSDDLEATATLVRQVLAAIDESGSSSRIIISSFDLTTCAYARSMDGDTSVAWLMWDVAKGDALVQAHLLGFNAVNPHFSAVDAEVIERARELDLDVNVWTVNRAEDLERMTQLNVARIITDDPALARGVVSRASSDRE